MFGVQVRANADAKSDVFSEVSHGEHSGLAASASYFRDDKRQKIYLYIIYIYIGAYIFHVHQGHLKCNFTVDNFYSIF